MSYGQQDQGRPGFSSSNNSFESFGQPQQSQQQQGGYGQQQQQPPAQSGGYQQQQSQGGQGGYQSSNGGGSNSGGYGSGNSAGGYGSQQSSGYGGGQSSGGGWKGGGGQSSGGWKGGGGGGWKGGGGNGGSFGKGGFQRPQLSPEQLAAMPLPLSAVLDGNSRAPEQLVPVIREIADLLKRHGFAIRTGGMDGFSKLVMDNVPGCELHIPWRNFGEIPNPTSSFSGDECNEFAKRYMPGWDELKNAHKGMFSKNVRLVFGKSLKQPCQIAIIWSEDGVEGPANRGQYSQHAGHVAAICHAMKIPVININNPDAVQRLRRFLGEQ